MMSHVIEGRFSFVHQRIFYRWSCAGFELAVQGLHGCFFRLMTKPPAPAIRSFMQSDPVYPGLQTGLAVEVFHSAKHFEENFLRGVGGVGWISEHPINQAINRLMKFADEPGVGIFRT